MPTRPNAGTPMRFFHRAEKSSRSVVLPDKPLNLGYSHVLIHYKLGSFTACKSWPAALVLGLNLSFIRSRLF
jgi:hypothetical protein